MIKIKKTWREKHLAREEGDGNSCDSEESRAAGQADHEEPSDVMNRGEPEQTTIDAMGINMVFVIPEEFRAPENEVAYQCLRSRLRW
jgi:hypothetical protein